MTRILSVALAALAISGLSACGESAPSEKATAAGTTVGSGTLASAVADAPGMTTVASALKSTGLASVFDGSAPYTLLAPDDDAFGALGEAGTMLKAPENGAAMAEVIKGHVLPGFTTIADIDAALKASAGKPVKMATMDGGEVTFARNGDGLTITGPDGATAKVDGNEVTASNGIAIPIDAVLRKVPADGG